ncbi:MAG: hypothetical protein R3E10_08305 [Gemmatimonadota bacterium]
MTEPQERTPSILRRIKERALVQWSLAYLAAAWAVLEIIDFASAQFFWSSAIPRGAAILAVAGFFLTLVVAWYHGEKGRQRVSGPELLLVAGLALAAGVALSVFAPGPPASGAGAPSPTARTSGLPRVAVLPCTNQSPDAQDPYRASGLHDEILLKLQKVSSLESIGRTSVLRYGETGRTTSEIASDLAVDYVGECTVQRSAPRIRVIFQLLDARGVQVWADDYDRDLTLANILDIQIDIAQQVAGAIGATVTGDELDRITRPPTLDLTAYELYQAGRTRWMTRWGPSMLEAIGFFEAAAAEDSTFALAHAGLAQAHMLLPIFEDRPAPQQFAIARREATVALAMNPDLAEAHAALGYIAFAYDWDWTEAESELQRAIMLNPNDAETRGWYSDLLHAVGRSEEARIQAEKGMALDPLSWSATNAALASTQWESLEEPERLVEDFLAANPGHSPARFALSILLLLESRYEESGSVAKELWEAYGLKQADSIMPLYRSVGDPRSRDRVARLLELLKREVTDPDARALTGLFHMLIDDDEGALEDARFLVDARSYHATQLRGWTPLYDQPRFLELLDQVGLPRPDPTDLER